MKTKINYLLCLMITAQLFSCVQETHVKEIYFEVDAREAGEIENLGVRGSLPPLSWDQSVELTDPDGDGIYQGIILVDTGHSRMSFKFVTGDGSYELPNQENRSLNFEYRPEVIKYMAVWNQPDAKVETD